MMLTISQVAKRANVNPETVRYYERRALIPKPARSPSGYREYPEHTVAHIGFIKRAQLLGFSLEEIADLLRLRTSPAGACPGVEERARARIADIVVRIEELQKIRAALEELVAACLGNEASQCLLLEVLEGREVARS